MMRGTAAMTVRELIDVLGQHPANADVEVMDGFDFSLPLTREGLEIDPNGETLYLGGCDPTLEWD
jgi:hypothetical protein